MENQRPKQQLPFLILLLIKEDSCIPHSKSMLPIKGKRGERDFRDFLILLEYGTRLLVDLGGKNLQISLCSSYDCLDCCSPDIYSYSISGQFLKEIYIQYIHIVYTYTMIVQF